MALTLLGSTLGILNLMVQEEMDRRQAKAIGQDLRFMTESVRRYVDANYDEVRRGLLNSASGRLIGSISMNDVARAGYLPSSAMPLNHAVGGTGHSYHLLVRGVSRQAAGRPQPTLTVAAVDANADGLIDGHLTDGNAANGELDLEAILVTVGGEPVEPQHGNLAVISAELFSVGYQHSNATARGAYGAWELDTSAYSGLAQAPQDKRFVSLIALSGHGVLGGTGRANDETGNSPTGEFLRRCPNASGSTLEDCQQDNRLYTDVEFTNHDTDGDGDLDYFGSLRNLHELEMAAIDSDGDGSLDVLSVISGVAEFACGGGSGGSRVVGTLLIDCSKVAISDDLSVGGKLEVSGSATLEGPTVINNSVKATGPVAAERFRAAVLDGQDLTKGVFHADLVAMTPTPVVPKPACRDAGSQPQVFAVPAAFLSPAGASIVGVRAYAADGPDEWRIGMEASVNEDADGDGRTDVITLSSANDYVLVLTKCS